MVPVPVSEQPVLVVAAWGLERELVPVWLQWYLLWLVEVAVPQQQQ